MIRLTAGSTDKDRPASLCFFSDLSDYRSVRRRSRTKHIRQPEMNRKPSVPNERINNILASQTKTSIIYLNSVYYEKTISLFRTGRNGIDTMCTRTRRHARFRIAFVEFVQYEDHRYQTRRRQQSIQPGLLARPERRRDDRIQLLFLIRTTTAGCLAPSPAPPEAARE